MFAAGQVVALWERARGLHAIDRVLSAIALALPDTQLADAPVGERCRAALRVLCSMRADALAAEASCPACGERHELEAPREALIDQLSPDALDLQIGLYTLNLRALTSRDQASVVQLDEDAAVQTLLARCVSELRCNGVPSETTALPAEVVEQIASRLAELDPNAETLLSLRCVRCGESWELLFDAGEFLLAELSTRARTLLYEVHLLARNYGWSEHDILALSDRRRASYVELVGT
jgi:hypothetical protein